MSDCEGVVYLAGPMSGLPDFNYPAFTVATERWRNNGWSVHSPAENFNGDTTLTRPAYFRADFHQILESTAIAFLPGWRSSKGASLEHAVAVELGLDLYDAETMLPLAPETVLQEAQRLVHGDRQAQYGHPMDDFTRTAAMWTALIGAPVSAEMVGLCMVAVKLSRQVNGAKRDNMTDAAGYAATVQMVIDERTRRAVA